MLQLVYGVCCGYDSMNSVELMYRMVISIVMLLNSWWSMRCVTCFDGNVSIRYTIGGKTS